MNKERIVFVRPRNPANGTRHATFFGKKGDENVVNSSKGTKNAASNQENSNGSNVGASDIALQPLLPQPVGLVNSGVNCYFNASLQGLFACPIFIDFLGNLQKLLPAVPNSVDVLEMLASLLGKYQSTDFGKRRILNAMDVLRAVRRASQDAIRMNRQEDAHEAMCVLFDMMEKSCLRRLGLPATSRIDRTSESTLIHSLFGGSLTTATSCPSCKHRSLKTESFLQLSLVLDAGKERSIPQLLKKMSEIERLDAKNMWECDGCKRKVCAERQTTVSKTPPILIVHLERFGYSFINGGMKRTKLKTPIRLASEELIVECNGVKVTYSMVGVLVHQGASVHSGHYFSYVKSARNGFWYEVDDEVVARVQPRRVLEEKQAYMLFYCRKDQARLNQITIPTAVIASPRPVNGSAMLASPPPPPPEMNSLTPLHGRPKVQSESAASSLKINELTPKKKPSSVMENGDGHITSNGGVEKSEPKTLATPLNGPTSKPAKSLSKRRRQESLSPVSKSGSEITSGITKSMVRDKSGEKFGGHWIRDLFKTPPGSRFLRRFMTQRLYAGKSGIIKTGQMLEEPPLKKFRPNGQDDAPLKEQAEVGYGHDDHHQEKAVVAELAEMKVAVETVEKKVANGNVVANGDGKQKEKAGNGSIVVAMPTEESEVVVNGDQKIDDEKKKEPHMNGGSSDHPSQVNKNLANKVEEDIFSFDKRAAKPKKFRDFWDATLDQGKRKKVRTHE